MANFNNGEADAHKMKVLSSYQLRVFISSFKQVVVDLESERVAAVIDYSDNFNQGFEDG